MTRRLLLSFFFAATAAWAAVPAPQEYTSITADRQDISLVTGEMILTGHPAMDYGRLRITADEVRYNPKSRVVTALGHATFTDGPRRLLADKIVYHAVDGTFEVGDIRLGEYPVYVSGASASGTRQSITIVDARVSLTEPNDLVPTLHAARLFFARDHQVRAEQANVGVGSVRPLVFGTYEHDIRQPLLSNVSVTGGYRSSLGVFTLLGLHVPVTTELRLGADLGLYTNRGVLIGPAGSYESSSDRTATFSGLFRSGWISDDGPRYTDILGRPVPRQRGFVEWVHQSQLTDRLTLNAQVNYWRDSEVVRDFRPADFFNVQQPDTYLESVYSGDNYLVSLFARFQPNTWETVQQRLPELRFDLLPLPVGGGFIERFNASLAVLRDDPAPAGPLNLTPGTALNSDRLDAFYSLSRPIHPTEWLTLTPVAGGRLTHYAGLDGARSDYTRALGELGVDAELHASGTWDYKNQQWKIDGLRHLLTPRLSYRYIPEADKGSAYIPAIDRQGFSTYLQPLELGDQRNLDRLSATNTLRIGIDNTLQTRDPVYGSRDLVRLNVADDFLFHTKPGERDVSEIHTELGVMPVRWLELSVYNSFAPQDWTLREIDTALTLRDGDAWTLRFASNFLRHTVDDYYLEGTYRLNEAYEAVTHLRYDVRAARFDEQVYGIRQNLGNTWRVEYAVTIYNGPRRESRFGLSLRVDAIRF